MVRGVRADRQQQSVAIHNRHDFHALSALRRADLGTSALRHYKCRVDEALFFIQRASVAKLIGDVRQYLTQDFAAAPSLKPAMHRFVIWIVLRQHMPLRASVQNPQHGFKDLTRRNGLTASASFGNVFFRKNDPGYVPIANRSAESFDIYSRPTARSNFEIGSGLSLVYARCDGGSSKRHHSKPGPRLDPTRLHSGQQRRHGCPVLVRTVLCSSAFSLAPPLRLLCYFRQVRLLHRAHRGLQPPVFTTRSRPRQVGTAMEIPGFPGGRLLRMPGSTTTRGRLRANEAASAAAELVER